MSLNQTLALTYRTDTNRLLRRWAWLSRSALFAAVLVSDIAVILTMSGVTGIGYHLFVYGIAGDTLSYLEVGSLSAILFTMFNVLRGEYALPNYFSFKPHLRRTVRPWTLTFVCLLALGFLAHISAIYSRGWMILYYASTVCALIVLRYLFVRITVLAGRNGMISAQRIFLFGTGSHVEDFVTRYRPRMFGVNIVGCRFLTPMPPAASPEARRQTLDADLAAAVASARVLRPDAIFVVMPWSDRDTINYCAETLLSAPAEIHLGAEQILDRFDHVQISKIGKMSSLQLTRLPLSRYELIEKRALDLAVASLALLLLTPVLIAAAILIKLDSAGPVFFLQRRFGFNQNTFRIIKFRTMHAIEDGPLIKQATKGDPRITRLGAFLRRWNIDELPQLFNVIKGDMSLVGPRPHALSHDREYERRIALYARRHKVKPGITGWAQIHGYRGETDTDEKMRNRVEYDLHYIDNWSLLLDLQILVQTVISPRSYRNAH
jgi:Undecaprenyl-phosphate glucose phosphotransferase